MTKNIHPYSTTIEVAEESSVKSVNYQQITGYNVITTFEGCLDDGKSNICPSDADKSMYAGDAYSEISGLGLTSQGCTSAVDFPHEPGIQKCLDVKMSKNPFLGASTVEDFYSEEADTTEVYSWDTGWKRVNFKEVCGGNVNNSNSLYDLNNDIFTNTVGVGLKVTPHADVYFNGISAGPNNTNSLTVRLRIVKTRATDGNKYYYYKTSSGGGIYKGSADFNDKCASNCYVNTQNLGGFGLSNSAIWMGMGDTLEFQMLIGRDDTGFDDTNDSTYLCDGGFPSPPGLGLTQDPNNCAIGYGSRCKWKVDYSNITQVTGVIPSFCTDPQTNQPGSYMYKPSGFGLYGRQPNIPNNSSTKFPCNVAGRSLYFTHKNKASLTTAKDKRQEIIIADIVDMNPSSSISGIPSQDRLLLKGNGEDHMNALSNFVPEWYTGNNYNWYISAYQHGGNWDTSGVGFQWEDKENKNSSIISYEQKEGAGKEHSIYDSEGELGYRSIDIYEEGFDCWEVEVSVTSLNNCSINIHEGTATNPALTATNPAAITSPGTYKYCLAALQATGMWGDCSSWTNNSSTQSSCGNDGSVAGSSNNSFAYFNAGGIKILTVRRDSSSGSSSCNISNIKITKKTPEVTSVNEPIYGGTYTYDVSEYDWKKLDVLESKQVPLALTFAIGDLKNIDKRTAGFSKTFNLPASSNNEKLLGSMLAVGVERQHISWQKARVITNGIVIFKGLLRIEKGTTGKGGSYKCHLIEDTIDWSKAIGDKELCDISIVQNDPTEKTRQAIIDSWTLNKPYDFDKGGAMGSGQTLAEDYFWGVASYGEWHRRSIGAANGFSHDTFDFHPVVYATRVVEKIFLQSGYTLDSNFWKSVTASLLCHPFGSGEDYYESDPNSLIGSSGSHVAEAKHPGGTCAGNYQSGGKIPGGGYNRTWYPVLNVQTDLSSNMTGTSSNTCGGSSSTGYVIPFSGQYDVTLSGNLHTSQSSAGNGAVVRMQVLKNGSSLFGWSLYSYGAWSASTQSSVFTFNAGDILSVRINGENFASYFSCWQDVEDIRFLVYPDSGTTPPAQHVNFNKIFDCGTKQIDYLKGFTDMFNLQWTADEESKVVYCEPYDDFYGSGNILDWTDKLDHTTWTDKFIIEELAKNVTFKYAVDSGDEGIASLQRYLDHHNRPTYKSHTQNNEEKFRKEELELGTDIFSSTYRFNNYGTESNPGVHGTGEIGWGDMTWTSGQGGVTKNPLMPVMWMSENGSINKEYPHRPDFQMFPKTDLRVVNYYSLLNGRLVGATGNMTTPSITECRNWKFYESNEQTINHFPYMDWIDGYKRGVSEDPYNLSWGDYDDGFGNISKGLYSKYWNTAYQKMNGGAALRTCKMNLTPNDIAAFDYRDLIKIFIDKVATYWTVQKIKDYKPNQEVLTTVELVEYKSKVYFGGGGSHGIIKKGIDNDIKKADQSKGDVMHSKGDGVSISNNTNNMTKGSGIALGHGVIANSNQTVVGRYNAENTTDVFSVGSGTGNSQRHTALSISESGEVIIQGGELVVEETTGEVHDLVYTDKVTREDGTIETSVKKVYLKKK